MKTASFERPTGIAVESEPHYYQRHVIFCDYAGPLKREKTVQQCLADLTRCNGPTEDTTSQRNWHRQLSGSLLKCPPTLAEHSACLIERDRALRIGVQVLECILGQCGSQEIPLLFTGDDARAL